MKRVLVAIGLLLGIAIGCVTVILGQHRILEQFLTQTEQMETLFVSGDVQGAAEAAELFAKEYRRKTAYFSLFLPQAMLTETEKSVVSLSPILTNGEHKDFVTEVRRCRMLLQKLHDMEVPTVQNVF